MDDKSVAAWLNARRKMIVGVLAMAALLTSSAMVAAQTPEPTRVPTPAIQIQAFAFDSGPAGLTARATPDDVVSRLMSFDRDQDGKHHQPEIPAKKRHGAVRAGDAHRRVGRRRE